MKFKGLTILTKRADFQRAARGRRVSMPAFTLQCVKQPAGEEKSVRVGFTCSKKVGNAVARNRAKRRLREVARLTLPELGQVGYDYVLVGRRNVTAKRPFHLLVADFHSALAKINT